MTTIKNRRRRRNILTHPRFQFRLVFIHTAFVLVVLSALVTTMLMPLYYEIQTSPQDLWVRYVTAEMLLHLVERLGMVVVVVIIISAVYHLMFSHRLCGPLVNFSHTFDAIGRGDLSRKVRLRKRDYLKEEAARFNDALSLLSAKAGTLKVNNEQLLSVAELLDEGNGKSEVLRLLQEDRDLLDQWILETPETKKS
jgi:methyl-accepting chemotaxis protein